MKSLSENLLGKMKKLADEIIKSVSYEFKTRTDCKHIQYVAAGSLMKIKH